MLLKRCIPVQLMMSFAKVSKGISDLIQIPGLINLDFADVKTIMTKQGEALMGIGVGKVKTVLQTLLKWLSIAHCWKLPSMVQKASCLIFPVA